MSATPRLWRLLDTGAGDPAWNMAVDEALLAALPAEGPPVLRLYRWSPPAVSLGRFQPAAEVVPPPGAVLVRRPSGGAALHHQRDELTYAVVAPYSVFPDRRPRTAYEAIHAALRHALASLGVATGAPERPGAAPRHGMCFHAPTEHDIIAGGRKLVGSAQLRRGRAFLQHGAIPFSPSPLSPEAAALGRLCATPPSPAALGAALTRAFGDVLGVRFVPDALRPRERDEAERLRAARYAAGEWTFAL
ncbi:MAG: lipoate--protein ligase family protein [Planctomycetota bacterium]|nr:MAG: lipoate--protein ligase family protein [Planctomycetota bacterium]